MTNIRHTVKKSEWGLQKHEFLSVYHYALQYPLWKDEYESLSGGLSSVANDGMPHAVGTSNPTESKAMRMAELSKKISIIEDTAKEAGGILAPWILKAVTHEEITYNYLRSIMDIPCGKNMYYSQRRKFYYLLSRKLNK